MCSLFVGSSVPVLAPAALPETQVGNLTDLGLSVLELRCGQQDLLTAPHHISWLDDEKSTEPGRVQEAAKLAQAAKLVSASPLEVLTFLLQMTPQERIELGEAYYQKFGAGLVAYELDHTKCLLDALVASRHPTQPSPWTESTSKLLNSLLSGQKIDRQLVEVELAVAALGFKQGMKEGDVVRVHGVDFNFILQGKKTPEERQAFIALVERQIGKYLTAEKDQPRRFLPDATQPGAALESYLSRYSAAEPETVTVLTVNQEYFKRIQSLATKAVNPDLSDGERHTAAAELAVIYKKLEAERQQFRRAEEQLRRGEIREMPALLDGNLRYFDKTEIRVIDSRVQWTHLVRTLIAEGAQEEKRVALYIERVRTDDARTRKTMTAAQKLGGEVDTMLTSSHGSTVSLARLWTDYRGGIESPLQNSSFDRYVYGSKKWEIGRMGSDVERQITVLGETQDRVTKTVAEMGFKTRAGQSFELMGNRSELLGDHSAAQNSYNNAHRYFLRAEEVTLRARK